LAQGFSAGSRWRGGDIGRLLREALGDDRVADDPWERRLFDHDVAPTLSLLELMYRTTPDAVVRPRDTEQVSTVLRLANKHRFPVIPRGAATWGLGGSVPVTGGVVLDLTSMGRVLEVDTSGGTVLVESGAVWQNAIEAARKKGLHIGTYPSSYPSATVGGWIAVGGVGVGTCRYGRIGENIEWLEAVLPDGTLVESSKDFSQFVGTEGIMGVVTKARLRAHPLPDTLVPVSYAFPDLESAGPFVGQVARDGEPLEHLMFADAKNFEWRRLSGIETGVESSLVTVVLAGPRESVESRRRALDERARSSGGRRAPDGVAENEWRERSREYRMRRAGTGSLPGEVLVPAARWGEAITGAYGLIRSHRLNAVVKGTLADKGGILLTPSYLIDERQQRRSMAAMTFNYRLAELALGLGGRPVGLGIYLAFLLERARRQEEVSRLREMKRRLDPNGILNPGKLLVGRNRFGMPMPPGASVLMMKLYSMLRSRMEPERFLAAAPQGDRAPPTERRRA